MSKMNHHIRMHHIHDKHKMHSKKRKADGEVSTSTVVSVNDSLAICDDGDGDDDDAGSVQSDSYCYSEDMLNEAVLKMKIHEESAQKIALSYTEELVHLDMNPILQEERIVTACEEVDKQVQDVVNSVPALNAKIPKIFHLISYLALFLSIPIWGMTISAGSSNEKLLFCFIGSLLFSFFLFFAYAAHFVYFHWKQEKVLRRLKNPFLITIIQFYYIISSLIIGWVSYTLSGGKFPQLLFYLIVLFLPVFLGKGLVRIEWFRDVFVQVSSKSIS